MRKIQLRAKLRRKQTQTAYIGSDVLRSESPSCPPRIAYGIRHLGIGEGFGQVREMGIFMTLDVKTH